MIEELLEFERINLFATKIDRTQFESFVLNLFCHNVFQFQKFCHSHRRFSRQRFHEKTHRRSKKTCNVVKDRLYLLV